MKLEIVVREKCILVGLAQKMFVNQFIALVLSNISLDCEQQHNVMTLDAPIKMTYFMASFQLLWSHFYPFSLR